MSLIIKKKKAVAPLAAGTYTGICVGVVDLGTQHNEMYKKYSQRVMLIWEIPSETVEVDGERKPRWQSKEYNASLTEKSNLFKDISSLCGKPVTSEEFDLKCLLGQSAILSVIIKETKSGSYNDIGSIMAIPAGIPHPTTESELLLFDMDSWDDKVLEALPGWIQDKVRRSTEYQQKHAPETPVDFPGDKVVSAKPEEETEEDVPF